MERITIDMIRHAERKKDANGSLLDDITSEGFNSASELGKEIFQRENSLTLISSPTGRAIHTCRGIIAGTFLGAMSSKEQPHFECDANIHLASELGESVFEGTAKPSQPYGEEYVMELLNLNPRLSHKITTNIGNLLCNLLCRVCLSSRERYLLCVSHSPLIEIAYREISGGQDLRLADYLQGMKFEIDLSGGDVRRVYVSFEDSPRKETSFFNSFRRIE